MSERRLRVSLRRNQRLEKSELWNLSFRSSFETRKDTGT